MLSSIYLHRDQTPSHFLFWTTLWNCLLLHKGNAASWPKLSKAWRAAQNRQHQPKRDIPAPSQLQGRCPSTWAGRMAMGKERSSQGQSLYPAHGGSSAGWWGPLGQSALHFCLWLPPLLPNLKIRLWKRAVAGWILLLFLQENGTRCF